MSGVGSPDFFYREAQRLGYVARSALKLIEIQKQFKLIAPGSSALDLGCAPGAWLRVACQNLGSLEKSGAVVEQKVKVPSSHCDSRVRTLCADVMSLLKKQAKKLSPQERDFSVVLSDMCPVVSGITTRDAALSCVLGRQALSLAGFIYEDGVLRPRGVTILKNIKVLVNFASPNLRKYRGCGLRQQDLAQEIFI